MCRLLTGYAVSSVTVINAMAVYLAVRKLGMDGTAVGKLLG
jgi:hypothetical protein